MHIVKILAMILLAVYLIFDGLMMLTDMQLPQMGTALLGLAGLGAGVLILVSIGRKDKS